MCVPISDVKNCSLTGAFDALPDSSFTKALALVCPLYTALGQDPEQQVQWAKIVALHAAHILHEAIKYEGEGGADGPVASESFTQVGSRSYAITPELPDGSNWWQSSPYGRTLRRYWLAMLPSMRAVG
jgi:hypothetical protein